MGDFSNRQKAKEEAKQRERTEKEILGKYFYDLSKLAFTALFLGVGATLVTDFGDVNRWLLIIFGAFSSFILAYIGYKIIKSN